VEFITISQSLKSTKFWVRARFPVHAMNMYRGSSDIANPILKLGMTYMHGVSFPLCFNLLIPLNGRLGGCHSISGRFTEEENLVSLPGIEPRIVQPAGLSAEQSAACRLSPTLVWCLTYMLRMLWLRALNL